MAVDWPVKGDKGDPGADGPPGTELIVGSGPPPVGVYAPGTTYLDELTGDLYRQV